MLKYFFSLRFEYYDERSGEKLYNGFGLGYYSSLTLAIRRREEMSSLPGFCLHPISCFKIKRVRVVFESDIVDKAKVSLFVLTHECEKDEYDIVTDFGAFSSYEKAHEQLEKYKFHKFYRLYPEGFVIDKHNVNRCNEWSEGFSS